MTLNVAVIVTVTLAGIGPNVHGNDVHVTVGELAETNDRLPDGVSLTVNDVRDAEDGTHFSVNIIPHTPQETTLGHLPQGRQLKVAGCHCPLQGMEFLGATNEGVRQGFGRSAASSWLGVGDFKTGNGVQV